MFSILAALVIGLGAAGPSVATSPAVIEAKALQERARADALAADAEKARASAAEAWARVDGTRVMVAAVADWAPAFLLVVFLAFALLVLGLAWAVVGWARVRATLKVVHGPAGPVLAYAHGGRLLLVDTSRNLGGAVLLDELSGRVALPMSGDEDTHAALASQSVAAGVIARVAGGDVVQRADVVERVGAGLHAVLGSLSLPGYMMGRSASKASTSDQTAPPGPALRFIRVKPALVREREAAELDAQDLRYFLAEGQTHGYGRAYWVGQALASGRRCTRARWTWMSGTLNDAGIMADGPNNTRVLAVDLTEAFDRLELAAPEAGQAW